VSRPSAGKITRAAFLGGVPCVAIRQFPRLFANSLPA